MPYLPRHRYRITAEQNGFPCAGSTALNDNAVGFPSGSRIRRKDIFEAALPALMYNIHCSGNCFRYLWKSNPRLKEGLNRNFIGTVQHSR